MNYGKIVKVPYGIPEASDSQNILKLNGFSVLETCILTQGRKGNMFLEDHLLLFVLSGTYTLRYGKRQVVVYKNEMIFLKKAIVVEYQKSGEYENNNLLDYWMFFLQDDLLKKFAKMSNMEPGKTIEPTPVSILPVSERLLKYLESLKPYFSENKTIDDNLIKLKLLELLYNLADTDSNLMTQLLQFRHPSIMNLADLMDENIMNPVSLLDLAYLSGRSISSFKRDFYAIYHMPPSHWIREHRISKAKELLSSTLFTITDVCFMTGFQNSAHFSRVFKEITGYSPTYYRQKTNPYVVSS